MATGEEIRVENLFLKLNPIGFIWFWVLGVKHGFLIRLNLMGFGIFTSFKLLE